MSSVIKGQKFFSLILTVFAVVGIIQHYLIFSDIKNYHLYPYIGIILVSIINLLTVEITNSKPVIFYLFRFIELCFVSMLIVMGNINLSSLFMLTVLIIATCLFKGSKGAVIISIIALSSFMLSAILRYIFVPVNKADIYILILDVVSIALIGLFSYLFTSAYEKIFKDLELAHDEATRTNYLLNNTIAELSTLQEISKFANSVLNIKELINIINDMIIGVIGVNYCSIFLIDDTTGNIYLEATNIRDKEILQNIKLTVASKYYSKFKSRGLIMDEGKVNKFENYPNAAERDIKTYLITSLQSHRNFLGLIVAESCFDEVFEERKKNMISTICNQVSIAIENAVIYDKMERLATIDGLTQVHNRRYFNERCLSEFANLSKSACVSVAMIDIDNFKRINDTYGHMVGDAVLKKVASIINSTTCASNSEDFLVARYGGEEFVILMRNTDLQTAYTTLEVVRKNIESCSVEDDGEKIRFTVSIGVAEYPATSSDVRRILQDADTALYKAKESGKNMVATAQNIK